LNNSLTVADLSPEMDILEYNSILKLTAEERRKWS
jgi:hypothetical protein